MRHSEEKIKARIIIPVILALVGIVFVSIISYHQLQLQHIDGDMRWRMDGVNTAFKGALEAESSMLDGLIGFIKRDKKIQDAWLSRDRERLYQHALPAYKRSFIDNRVTHFYFIDKDKKSFLREHNKGRHGDTIKRFTLDRAISTGKKTSGIELGPLGTFTLRVVHPWYINGELTGYIELGVEVTHITPRLRELFNVELCILVKKKFLDQKKWEEGRHMLHQEQDWGRYDDFVIVESSLAEKKIGVDAYRQHVEAHKKGLYRPSAHDIETVGKIYRAGFSPLIDAGERDVGELIVLSDVTGIKTQLWDTTKQAIVISFFILTILIGFFYFYISRLERRFVSTHNKVLDETRKREQAMEEARNAAISASQLKSQFFANMSHEIRTPMNGVAGMLQLLRETELSEEQKQYVDTAINSGDDLIKLIDNLLDYTRIDTGEMELNLTDFDLSELIESEINSVREKAEEKGIKLSFSVSKQVPVIINSDPERLEHILRSLLGNAIKFTTEGEVKVNVSLIQDDPSLPMLCLEVSDTGISVPEELQEKIFEVFAQADGTITRGFGGLGLGLAITRKLVEGMGGKITLQTASDVGSTFCVYLPFKAASSSS